MPTLVDGNTKDPGGSSSSSSADGPFTFTGVSGTNTIVGTSNGPDLAANQTFILIPAASNTGAVTLNGVAVKKSDGSTALSAGDLEANKAEFLLYDGSVYRLVEASVGLPILISQVTGLQAALDAKQNTPLSAADIPNHSAALLTSGTVGLARGGTGVDLSASGGTTKILAQDASQVISARDLVDGDLPSASRAAAIAAKAPVINLTSVGGTANAITATASGVTLAAGMVFAMAATLANTSTTVTANINGAGAITVKLPDGTTGPAVGDIVANKSQLYFYDGTYLRLLTGRPLAYADLPAKGLFRAPQQNNQSISSSLTDILYGTATVNTLPAIYASSKQWTFTTSGWYWMRTGVFVNANTADTRMIPSIDGTSTANPDAAGPVGSGACVSVLLYILAGSVLKFQCTGPTASTSNSHAYISDVEISGPF